MFTQTGSNSTQLRPGTSGSSVTDLVWIKSTDYTKDWVTGARLTGNKSLFLNADDASRTDIFGTSVNVWDRMSGTQLRGVDPFGDINTANDPFLNIHFTRKPGFMDVVSYKGVSASSLNVPHNLAVAPEFMIVYTLDDNKGSAVYVASVGNTKTMFISAADDPETRIVWNNTSPTATTFTCGADDKTNDNGKPHVAYLFATLSGISKVGSYTGTGSDIDVDCGFTNGARFVLIKRTDANGDWGVFTTATGITNDNDPYLRLNTDAAEITGYDYIDPLNSGFRIPSSAPLRNVSCATYIFLAIA